MATMQELIERLQVNPKNPRKHSDIEKKRIKQSLRELPEMLEARPIVFANGVIQVVRGRSRSHHIGRQGIDKWRYTMGS